MRTPLIRRLTLQNFLSYGLEGLTADLLPLNVLIGPNASGKSNLLEALAILRAAASDLQAAIREGGGIGEYLWKGGASAALISCDTYNPSSKKSTTVIRHQLQLAQVGTRLDVINEAILVKAGPVIIRVFDMDDGEPRLFVRHPTGNQPMKVLTIDDLKAGQSILSQRRDPEQYPELTFLAEQFANIALFQDWNFGRRSSARFPQPTDLPSEFLLPDASNLGLVLHDLGQTSVMREELISYLRRFYEPARYIATKIQGGTIQLFIEEEGGQLIPATRLSDGTLRYLCLLAILCHPTPPPVIAIEEPELGLHPDILPTIAELLRKASERTQLFVTTHSDALVSALSDTPESILVCEATPDGTTMKRLEAEPLREWLEKYSLGEIWRMGEIGGNRW